MNSGHLCITLFAFLLCKLPKLCWVFCSFSSSLHSFQSFSSCPLSSRSCLFPFSLDGPGSWGLQGFCVSVGRKTRRRKADKEGSWKRVVAAGACLYRRAGGIKERNGVWGTPGTLVPLFITFSYFHLCLTPPSAAVKSRARSVYTHTALSAPHYGSQVCSPTCYWGCRLEIQHQTHPSLWESQHTLGLFVFPGELAFASLGRLVCFGGAPMPIPSS